MWGEEEASGACYARQGEGTSWASRVESWAPVRLLLFGGAAPIYGPSIRDCLSSPFQVRREF